MEKNKRVTQLIKVTSCSNSLIYAALCPPPLSRAYPQRPVPLLCFSPHTTMSRLSLFGGQKKNVTVRVTTVDATLEYAITQNTTGQELFEQVCRHASYVCMCLYVWRVKEGKCVIVYCVRVSE